MKKTSIVILLVILLAVTVFYWNKDGLNSSKIGVIAPLTGIVASYGEDIKKGILSSEINTSTFIFEDDKCEPSMAVSSLSKLKNLDNVSLIIGPACGSPQESIVPILKQQDVVAIVPSAASQNLFSQSGGNLFNMQYSLEKEASFLAGKVYARNHKRVVVISYQNAFSKTVADNFEKEFRGEIVKSISLINGTSDISTEIAKLKNLDFDAVFVADISFFFSGGVNKLKQYEINVPLYTEYVAELPAVRPLVEGVIYSYPGELNGNGGAVFELSKEAAEISKVSIEKCGNDTTCIKKFLLNSGKFDEGGVSKRSIILKQIVNGTPVVLQ